MRTVHLIAPDAIPLRSAAVAALCAAADPAPLVLSLGGPPAAAAAAPCVRLPNWLPRALAPAFLGRAMHRAGLSPGDTLLHAWSPRATSAAAPLAAQGWRVLAEVPCQATAIRAAARWHAAARAATLHFVADSHRAAHHLQRLGVPPDRVDVVAPAVDFGSLSRITRDAARAALGLAPDQPAVLLLPPLCPTSRPYLGAWAALLVRQVLPALRVLCPGHSPESRRARRLAIACRFATALLDQQRIDAADLPTLLRAADAALYLPTDDAPVDGLPWAMAAGTPLVATAVPCITEFVAHDQQATLCLPNSPRDAARRLLQVLEDTQRTTVLARRAAADAYALHRRTAQVTAYHALYSRLAGTAGPTGGVGGVGGAGSAGGVDQLSPRGGRTMFARSAHDGCQ